MTLDVLIEQYGYVVVLLGSFVEGETVLLLAGYAAHRGYLSFAWVLALAFAGTFTSDVVWFFLGRRKGRAMLYKHAKWRQRARRIGERLHRHRYLVMFGFRFFYGVRNITPLVVGASGFRRSTFLALSSAGALVWATLVISAGYLFGQTLEAILHDVRRYEFLVVVGIVVAVAVGWFVRRMFVGRRQVELVMAPDDVESCLPVKRSGEGVSDDAKAGQ